MTRRTTHFVDLDGVIVHHWNSGSCKQWDPRQMIMCEGTYAQFNEWERLGDCIIICTARPESLREELITWLRKNGLYWNQLIMGITSGSRILYNDAHPKYVTRVVILERNDGLGKLGDDELC